MNAQTPAAQSAGGGNGGKGPPPQNDGQSQTSEEEKEIILTIISFLGIEQIEPKNEPIQVPMDQSAEIGSGIQKELMAGQKIGSTTNLAIAAESPCGGCRELKR